MRDRTSFFDAKIEKWHNDTSLTLVEFLDTLSPNEIWELYLDYEMGNAYSFEECYIGEFTNEKALINFLVSKVEKIVLTVIDSIESKHVKNYLKFLVDTDMEYKDPNILEEFGIENEYFFAHGHAFTFPNLISELHGDVPDEYLLRL